MTSSTLTQIDNWLKGARKGERLRYHSGFLTIDREERTGAGSNYLTYRAMEAGRAGDLAYKAYLESQALLVQCRTGHQVFDYWMVKI